MLDDEEAKQSSRSFFSSGSRGSNPEFASTCARTFASSGGVIDHASSQMQLTYDMQQMHSSFDLGNDHSYNYNRLTPRETYSNWSDQFYGPHHQFNSFHGFTKSHSNQYGTISYEGHDKLRNCYSVASLDCIKAYSNPSENYCNTSFNSTIGHNKKISANDSAKGYRKRCPVQDENNPNFKINIDNIIDGNDQRTTLMIKNIPNKYTGNNLRAEINKNNRDRYNFFYLPIDFSNNCNVGYAFINFIHSAYILDFYYEFNNKGWNMYNGNKVCMITYGSWQGKRQLMKKFKNTKVWKSHNQNIKPFVANNQKINEQEIKEILDRYNSKRKRKWGKRQAKTSREFVDEKKTQEKTDEKFSEDTKLESIQEPISESQKDDDIKDVSVDVEESCKQTNEKFTKISSIFIKRNSQKPSESNKKLDENRQGKRPASDDDKGASSEEDKPYKHDHAATIKSIKLNLKNICKTSRVNINSSNN